MRCCAQMSHENTKIIGVESVQITPDISYDAEEKVWLAFCTQLDVATWGDTFEETREMLPVCQEAGITAYPTWEINGEKSTGVKSIEQLNELSGCSLE